MDDVDEVLDAIDTIYKSGDRETALSNLEKIKERVDGLVEDLV